MKKLLNVLLIVLMAFSLVACSSNDPVEEPKDRLEKIKERGYIEICTEPYWAPNEFIDPTKTGDDKYVGADIEIMKAIADKIGVKLKVVPLEFTAVLASISEGRYDLAISALAWTAERNESMNLSKGYYLSDARDDYGFVMRKEDAGKYDTPESLADAIVVTQSGSIQESYYNTYVKTCKEFKRTSSMTDSYLSVKENKADVCVCAKDSAILWSEANGDVFVVSDYSFPFDLETGGTRVAAPKADTDSLIALVNEVIDELQTSGQLFEWNDYYTEYSKQLGIE